MKEHLVKRTLDLFGKKGHGIITLDGPEVKTDKVYTIKFKEPVMSPKPPVGFTDGSKAFEKKFDDHVKQNDERGAKQDERGERQEEFNKNQLEFNKKIRKDILEIKSCPTIKKELKNNPN